MHVRGRQTNDYITHAEKQLNRLSRQLNFCPVGSEEEARILDKMQTIEEKISS
jgi:hypothetical protein